jgi:MFS family permease
LTTNSRDDPLTGRRPGATGQFSLLEVLAIAAVLSGAFMVVLDFFIVIVALPSIQRDLNATPAMLGLVVAAYAVATAAGLVAGGRLGDVLGRKRMFLVGLAGFTVASVAGSRGRRPNWW